MYTVVFVKSVSNILRKLPKLEIVKIIDKAESLSLNLHPIGSKKLSGTTENLWRVRVGNYRIIYLIEEKIKVVKITKIGHRRNIYD